MKFSLTQNDRLPPVGSPMPSIADKIVTPSSATATPDDNSTLEIHTVTVDEVNITASARGKLLPVVYNDSPPGTVLANVSSEAFETRDFGGGNGTITLGSPLLNKDAFSNGITSVNVSSSYSPPAEVLNDSSVYQLELFPSHEPWQYLHSLAAIDDDVDPETLFSLSSTFIAPPSEAVPEPEIAVADPRQLDLFEEYELFRLTVVQLCEDLKKKIVDLIQDCEVALDAVVSAEQLPIDLFDEFVSRRKSLMSEREILLEQREGRNVADMEFSEIQELIQTVRNYLEVFDVQRWAFVYNEGLSADTVVSAAELFGWGQWLQFRDVLDARNEWTDHDIQEYFALLTRCADWAGLPLRLTTAILSDPGEHPWPEVRERILYELAERGSEPKRIV